MGCERLNNFNTMEWEHIFHPVYRNSIKTNNHVIHTMRVYHQNKQ